MRGCMIVWVRARGCVRACVCEKEREREREKSVRGWLTNLFNASLQKI